MIADGGGWTHRVAPVTSAPPPPPANTVVVQLASGPKQVTILPGATAQRPLATFIGPLTAETEVLRSGPPRPTNLQQVAANAPQFNPLPGAPPDRPLQGFIGPLSLEMEVLRSGPPARPLEGFIGPLSADKEVLRSGPPAILPRNLTEGSAPTAHPTAGLASDDPRLELIDQGYQLQQIDQQAKALAGQPIDIEAAKAQVQTAQVAQEQFWNGVYSGLKPRQQAHLASLAQAIDAAPEQGKLAALQKFESALAPVLTPEQRTQLLTLQRGTEDAQLKLEGQLLGKELRAKMLDGGFCGNEAQKAAAAGRLELVMVDARVHVAQVREIAANRKLQDAQLLLMTPQNQRTLAPQQQKLADAVRDVQLNPQDKDAQQRLTIAQTLFDGAMTMTVNTADKRAIDTLTQAVERERQLGALVGKEADALHRYADMKDASDKRCGVLNGTERRIFELAATDLKLTQAHRAVRELAVAAANASDPGQRQELLQQLDGMLVELSLQESDAQISGAEFTLSTVTLAHTAPALSMTMPVGAPIKTQSLQVAPQFAVSALSTDLTVEAATRQLEAAKQHRTQLDSELEKLRAQSERAPNERASWFEVIVGGLEVIGGSIMIATGVGTAFGVALAIHGAYKVSHGVHDLATNQTTDSWVSQGLQALGASDGVANAGSFVFDVGMTAGAGGVGVYSALFKSATWGAKLLGGTSGLVMADGWQAGARTAWVGLTDPNAHYTPYSTQLLMKTGMSEQAAAEVQVAVSALAPFGVSLARMHSARPPAFEQGFTAASPKGGSSFSYDFYGRKAPANVREEAANVLVADRGGDALKLASQLKHRTLVVERDASDNIVGAAVLRPNWRGTFGRDFAGERVKPGTTALEHVNGDDGGVRTTIAAIEGAGRFLPKQQGVAWDSDTLRPELSSQVTGAAARNPIIARSAPALLEQQGPQLKSTHEALYADDGSALPLSKQLRNLNELPAEQRQSWPEAAQHMRYATQLPARPVTFFGSESLGRVFHPIRSKDSWAGWVNNTVHPTKWGVNAYNAVRDRVAARMSSSSSSPSSPSPRAQAVREAWGEVSFTTRLYAAHARDLFTSIHRPVTAPAGRAFGWLNEHVNPYSLRGIEASTARGTVRTVADATRYGIEKTFGATKRVLLRATIPQAATGNVDIVVDDNRYLTPWNVSTGNLGRHSIAIDFPLTGTRFGAWVGGPLAVRQPYIPGVEAPFVDEENGSMPMARFGAPPTDPQGPKALRFITMFRSMLADAGVAIRWGGVNDFYATTSATVKIGTGALSFSGSLPAEKGGQKGLSTLGAFTSLFPNVASSVFVGPVGSVNVSRQTMPMFNLDSNPVSAAAKSKALLAGNHYTVGTDKASASTGQFFLLNPSHGREDPSEARRAELWRNFSLTNWLG